MIGQTLNNRYQINTRIDKGAMGIVYRASDTQHGKEVALKVISSELAIDPAMLERFKREGEALRRLKHPNIVEFLDAFQHDEHYVIVMEYVSGGSLHKLIKKESLPIERASQITLDLCDALIRAHRLHIIHRDIKPENILMDEDGTPKLADFGVARLSEGTRMTRSGTQVGTPYYMAPEAWKGETLDGQADIWSLGVVLFEMLSGQVPFDGDTGPVVMTKVFTTQTPDLKKLRSEVPSALVRIVNRMLTRDKGRRYKTMREVAVDLERVQQLPTPVPKARPKPRDPAEVERRRERQAARRAALTKNVNTAFSSFRSAFTKVISGLKSGINKAPPYLRIAGVISVVIALIYFLSVQLRVNPALTPVPTSSMVFSGTSAGEVNFFLYDAANETFSTIDVGGGNNWDPILSLRGEIYFTSNREDNKAEIYRLENGEVKRVTDTPGGFESWGPTISNLGEVYFTSNREDGKAEIYRLMKNGGLPQRVTDTPGNFESWGPVSSGQKIYFTSNRSNKSQVYLLNPLPIRDVSTFESWTNYLGERIPNNYLATHQLAANSQILTIDKPGEVYLGDLTPKSATVGYGVFSVGILKFNDPGNNIAFGDPITVLGIPYEHGLQAHAQSMIVYLLGGKYVSIETIIGKSDSCGDGAIFRILGDGKELFASEKIVRAYAEYISLNITGVDTLTLIVDSLETIHCDGAIWGDPILTP